MARIIKKGGLPEDKLVQVKCWKCRSVIEFQVKEGELRRDHRDGDYYDFKCPVCQNVIGVSVKVIEKGR